MTSQDNTSSLDKKGIIRWGMLATFVLLVSFILPRFSGSEFDYEVGKKWTGEDLISEFEFPLFKSVDQLKQERDDARSSAIPIFILDTLVKNFSLLKVNDRLDECASDLVTFQQKLEEDVLAAELFRKQDFLPKYKINPNHILQEFEDVLVWNESLKKDCESLLRQIYEKGLMDKNPLDFSTGVIAIKEKENTLTKVDVTKILHSDQLKTFMKKRIPRLKDYESILLEELIFTDLRPNIQYSEELSEQEAQRLLESILEVYGHVASGEMIIRRGEEVTTEKELILKSYLVARTDKFGERNTFAKYIGQVIIVSILTLLMAVFLRNNRPMIFFRNRRLAMILLMYFFMIGVLVLVLNLSGITKDVFQVNYVYLTPLCMIPILLTAFFDLRVGFFGNILMGLFAGSIVPNGFEVFFIQAVAGTIAVYSLRKLRNRADFFISLSYIFLAYTISYIGYSFFIKGSFITIQYSNLILFLLNVLFTFITYPLIYIFEKVFGLTSDLTFIELLDTNHPLLNELSRRAPGTFQHSLQVSNISEAVVNRIGGNSLATKVGGLFHDVGKMVQPQFFIENQKDHENPHEKLSYEDSSKVIIQHVQEGVRLAQEHNLPSEIIAFIRTHHGTTRTEYFYRKYLGEHPGEDFDEDLFNYPGPTPHSKETAVVMIVDSAEAACRAMKSHSPKEIEALIEKIVSAKISQHQFDNANITFRDIVEIKRMLYTQLVSIYHGRIEYPDEPKDPASSAKA